MATSYSKYQFNGQELGKNRLVLKVIKQYVEAQNEQERLGPQANGETLQAFQLLNSWLATAHDNDVELKVFVAP